MYSCYPYSPYSPSLDCQDKDTLQTPATYDTVPCYLLSRKLRTENTSMPNHNAQPKTNDNTTTPPTFHQPPCRLPGAAPFFDELPLPVLIPNGKP